MNSPIAVSSRGLAPAEHCSCLRGLATQWEGAGTKLSRFNPRKENCNRSAILLKVLPREASPDHCDTGLYLHREDYTATPAQRMRRSTPTSFHVRSWCSPRTVSAPTVEP